MTFCYECKSKELNLGCQYCCKAKIEGLKEENKQLKSEVKFYKNELELINHG